MSVYGDDDDDDDDAADAGPHDREAPADADIDHGDSVDTLPCPYCGKAVYEQAEVCHHCGSFLSIEDRPPRKPLWILVTVIVCLALVLVGWLFAKPFV